MWKTLERVSAAQDTDELVKTFFIEIKRLIPHRSAVYFPVDLVTQIPSGTGHIAINLPDYIEAGKRYGFYYYALDPLKALTLPSNINKPKKTTDYVHPDKVTEGEYYNDFLKPLGIVYCLGCNIGLNGKSVGGLALHRGVGVKDFTERERAILGHLAPHLAYSAYNLTVGRKKSTVTKKGKKRADDYHSNASMAVWTLDIDLNLISQNVEGLKLGEKWSSRKQLADKSPFISLIPIQVAKMLLAVVSQLNERQEYGMGAYVSSRNMIVKRGGENYMCACSILTPCRSDKMKPALLLTAELMAKREKASYAEISYDFTPREEEITALVAQGYKNSEIAEKLFIMAETVKGHLKSVYRKTGVRNRGGLISKLFISRRE